MKTGKKTRVRITSPGTVRLSKPAVEKETRKITVSLVLSWIFGVFFGLGGLAYLKGPLGVAIPCLLISAILLPPVNKFVKEKFNIELSRGLKIAIVVILFFVAGANMPASSVTGSSVQSEMKQNAEGVTGVPTPASTETIKTTSPTTPQQTAQPKNQKEITISSSSSTQPYLLVIGNSPSTSGTIAASAGKEFVVVEATITNNGYDKFAVNPYSFTVTINRVKYDIDAVHTFMVGNKLDSVELLDGGSTTGSIVFEIPSDIAAQDYQLKYDETCLFNCHEFVYK